MKNRFSKILGIVLALTVLAGLLIVAAPVSAASMAWSAVNIPNTYISNNLVVGTSNDWLISAAPDGKTIFAVETNTPNLYKSTNGGLSFSTSSLAVLGPNTTTATGMNIGAVVALAVSSDYAADSTIVIATGAAGTPANTVYRSVNGGVSFGAMPVSGLAGTITCVDVGPHYAGGQAILVGTSTGTAGGGASRLSTSTLAWTNLQFPTGDIYAIAFSPNHRGDAEVLAVGSNGASTYLWTKFGSNLVNADISASQPMAVANSITTTASIAFPADYDWSGNNVVFVGLGNAAGAQAGNDVYRVRGNFPPTSSIPSDLNLTSTTTNTNVYSVAFKGNLADGTLFVGKADSNLIWRATSASASAVTFVPSAKSPTGTKNTIVMASPVSGDTNVWAMTSGNGYAFSMSTDNGVIFNQTALIGISALANATITDIAVIDSDNMYMLLVDDVGGNGITMGDYSYLFKTSNGGANWMAVFQHTTAVSEYMNKIYLSPSYATDNTIYITQNDNRIWKSSNAGTSFIGLSSPNSINITAFAPIDGNSYYVGGVDAVFKSGSYVAGTLGGRTANSIAYISNTDMYVGTTNGSVYRSTNGGASFIPVGATGFTNPVIVLADVNYATNNTIYAGGIDGLARWTQGTSATWYVFTPVTAVNGLAMGTEGTLYVSNTTANALFRCVNPTAPPAPGLIVWDNMNFAGSSTNLVSNIPSTTAVAVLATGTAQVPNNTVYAIFTGAAAPNLSTRIGTFQDTMVVAPAISSPKAGAQVATNAALSWTSVAGAREYTAQLATDSALAGTVALPLGGAGPAAGVTAATSIYPSNSLQAGLDYWWRVRATSPMTSKYTSTTKFSVKLAEAGNSLEGVSGTRLHPAAGATNVPVKPVFEWAAVNGAASYDLQVADNPVFVNPMDSQTDLNTTVWTYTKTLDYSKTYYWRVRAVSAADVASDWVASAFTTESEAVAVTGSPTTVTVTSSIPVVTPTVSVVIPTQATPIVTVTIPPASATSSATPASIWVLIAIGAVLIIAVIVLIARTRRV